MQRRVVTIVGMAKTRRKRPQVHGRARQTGKTRLINFEIDVQLDESLAAAAEREKRTKRAILTLALERYLQQSS